MRRWGCALLLTAALASTGCFQLATVVHVKSDASGTIDQRLLFSPAALSQLTQLSMLGGTNGRPVDPTSEAQARTDAARLGPGATFVSSAPISDGAWQGRESVYAFTNINQLRVNPQPAAPGDITVRGDGIDSRGKAITFSLAAQPNGNALLTIAVPLPELPSGGLAGSRDAGTSAGQVATLKQVFGGAHVHIEVEPAGTLVRTSSPYVNGSRVTLLDVDLDRLLKDETLLPRLQAAKSEDEMKAILREAPGLEITFDRTITIEFTPRR